MSKSQEQSLNEDVVFFPTNESNPEFLHSEVERGALESLLRGGPGAFYAKLSTHQMEPFLCPEEVNQVFSWVEDHHVEVLENGDFGSENSSDIQSCSDQYFPSISDTPAPCLELGWPEKDRWNGVERAMVYTNPPMEQAPHIREVIRRLLQGATMVGTMVIMMKSEIKSAADLLDKLIAIAADRITDSTVIGDLHSAASRGVVIYVILNRRPAQDNLTPNQLKHPNIIVRILGGRTFMSGNRKMVEGELKENFILVDLEMVVLGSYSLTWTDAHLHRQLITVLSGPAVELFDREFRILYAASLPVPDEWKDARPMELPKIDRALYQPEPDTQKQVLLDCPSSPPPPIADSPIDWEALGVFQKNEDSPEDQDLPNFSEEPPKFHTTEPDWHARASGAGVMDLHITEWQDESKLYRVMPEPRHAPDHQAMFWNMQKPDRLQYRFLTKRDEGPSMFRHQDFRMDRNLMEDTVSFSRTHRQDWLPSLDRSFGENLIPEEMRPELAAAPVHHKKPIIVSVPQTEGSLSLADILKKLSVDNSTKVLHTKMAKNTISKSNLDLSSPGTETLERSQSQANLYDSFPITPALALMKKRNDEVKSSLMRNMTGFQPLPRPRSFSLGPKRDMWKPTLLREQNNDEDK